jgi:hypothetical protein
MSKMLPILAVLVLVSCCQAALKWVDLTARPNWATLQGTYIPTVWFDDGSGFPGILATQQQTQDTMAELGSVVIKAATRPALDQPAPSFDRGEDKITISSLTLLDSTNTYDGLFPFDLVLDHPEIIDQPVILSSQGNPDIDYVLSTNPSVPEQGTLVLILVSLMFFASNRPKCR